MLYLAGASLALVACPALTMNRLHSMTFYTAPPPGTIGGGYWVYPVNLPTTPASRRGRIVAGAWPTGAFWIQGVEMVTVTTDPTGFAVLGAQQPDGDYISPRTLGQQARTIFFPADSAFHFPNDGIRELHLHAGCAAGKTLANYCTVYFWQE